MALNTNINVTATSSDVATGLEPGKRALKDLGGAATDTGKALGGIGNGTAQSAQKVESATKSMIQSIQRTTAATEAGDKSSRAYQESLARIRGVDVAALKPYLDQLDAAKMKAAQAATANESFSASFNGIKTAALAAGAAIAAFGLFAKKINDGVDALNDLKDATGSSIENISALQDIAARTGTSFDTVGAAMIKFNKTLGDAKPGTDAVRVLEQLGLNAKELKNIDPAEALLKTAKAFEKFADDGNKARAMEELFGKSTKEVAAYLKDLAEKSELVGTVTTQAAQEAEKFNKELFKLEKNALDLARSLTSSLIPALNQVFEDFRNFGPKMDLGSAASEVVRLNKELKGLKEIEVGKFNIFGGVTKQIEQVSKDLDAAKAKFNALDTARPNAAGDAANAAYEALEQRRLANRPTIKVPEKVDPAIAAAAKKAVADYNKELEDQAKLLAELSGLTGSFSGDWDRLSAIYKKGGLSLDGLAKAQADLLAKQPAIKAATDAEAKSKETLAKANLAASESYLKYITSIEAGVDKINADIASQREATERMGLTKEAIASLDAAKLEMLATDLELQAIKVLDRNLDEPTYDALKKQAQAYRELASAKQAGAVKETMVTAAKEAADEWKKTSDSINSTLTDALMRGFESGKGFAKTLRDTVVNMFKTMILRPVISAIMSPVSAAIGGALGLSGAAQAGQAGGGVMGAVNSAGSFYNMLNGGVTNAITSGFGKLASSSVGQSLGLSNSAAIAGNNPSAYIPAGGELTSFGATASSWASAIGGTMAGIAMGSMAKKMISGGYSTGKGMETFQNIGIAVGSAIGGPVLGAIIGAGAGVFNRAFGRKLKDSGIEGSFGGQEGFSGNNYEFMKGGWFRSDKTNRSAIDPEIQKGLADQFKGLQVSSALMAQTLGLSAESVAGFTANIKLSFKDLTEAQINEKLALEFGKVSDSLAQGIIGSYKDTIATVVDQIMVGERGDGSDITYSQVERQVTSTAYAPSEFARDGETASQTLARLAQSITLVNANSDLLGNKLTEVGLKGANTASLLIDAFGGAERYAAQMGSYYQNFYTQEEQRAKLIENTSEAFTALGKTMPVLDGGARAAYRSMVELAAGQDMSVESNRAAYASLLSLQGAMNELAPAFVDAEAAAAALAESSKAAAAALAESSKAAAEALAKTNQGWQDQLDVLTGAQTDRSIALRDAADETTRAIMRQVYAQQDLKTASEAAAIALQGMIDAANSSKTSLADKYKNPLTLQSASAMLPVGVAEGLLGMSPTDVRTAIGGYISGLDPLTEAGRAAITQLAGLAPALDVLVAQVDSVAAAAAQAAANLPTFADGVNAAMSALKSSVDAQKTLVTDAYTAQSDSVRAALDTVTGSVGKLKSLSDSLKGTLDGLRVAGSNGEYRAAAQAQISAALAVARNSGTLPLDGQLTSALATVSKPSEALYGTFTDYARDFYKTANDIAALSDITGTQLTAEEVTQKILTNQLAALKAGFDAQIKALNSLADTAQAQVDAALGINSSVLSVTDALNNLAAVLGVDSIASSAATSGSALGISKAQTRNGVAFAGTEAWRIGDLSYDSIGNAYMAYGPTGSNPGVYTSAQLEEMNHWAKGVINTWADTKNLPHFATGTNYVTADGPAYLHEGEAVVPRAYNPAAGGSDDTASALRAMADRLDRIEANTRATAGHTAGTDRKLARVIPGNALITEAVV